jgi:hypothetical protein
MKASMPRASAAIIVAAVSVALSAQLAGARSLRLHSERGVLDEAALRTGFEIELSSLHVKSTNEAKVGNHFMLANASIAGHEVACINCNTDMFARWVKDTQGIHEAGCKQSPSDLGSKHPNSPGYKEWAKKNGHPSFLGKSTMPCNFSHFNASDIQIAVVRDWDLEALRPKLQSLWAQRRLVVGYGMNPLHQQMDFGEALMSLARNAPLLTPPECEGGKSPECNSVFSGLRKTASLGTLNTSLAGFFGEQFLAEHRYRSDWNTSEQRRHVQLVLTELKKNYFFYYQKCLAHEHDTTQCNPEASSELLGQMACQEQDDEVGDDCVYAELRFCSDCGSTSAFFEYSRFHGPLALFETKKNRKSLMGQCEEFSRAGHALLGFLGYEVRYVLDFTDHVWIEVQIPKGKDGKWIHADPSEGVMDTPLMYEKGWGKQLTMIFAFTPWSIEHVTDKYTADYAGTVLRRGIPDIRLNSVIDQVNHRLQYELPLHSWGYQLHHSSKDRSLREVALWSHFEGA